MSDNLLETVMKLTDEDWQGSNPLSPEFRANPYPGLKNLRVNFKPKNN